MNVDVPGKGTVSFPDDMPPEQVEKAIQEWIGPEQPESAPAHLRQLQNAQRLASGPLPLGLLLSLHQWQQECRWQKLQRRLLVPGLV